MSSKWIFVGSNGSFHRVFVNMGRQLSGDFGARSFDTFILFGGGGFFKFHRP
jgi:hypothetical protein